MIPSTTLQQQDILGDIQALPTSSAAAAAASPRGKMRASAASSLSVPPSNIPSTLQQEMLGGIQAFPPPSAATTGQQLLPQHQPIRGSLAIPSFLEDEILGGIQPLPPPPAPGEGAVRERATTPGAYAAGQPGTGDLVAAPRGRKSLFQRLLLSGSTNNNNNNNATTNNGDDNEDTNASRRHENDDTTLGETAATGSLSRSTNNTTHFPQPITRGMTPSTRNLVVANPVLEESHRHLNLQRAEEVDVDESQRQKPAFSRDSKKTIVKFAAGGILMLIIIVVATLLGVLVGNNADDDEAIRPARNNSNLGPTQAPTSMENRVWNDVLGGFVLHLLPEETQQQVLLEQEESESGEGPKSPQGMAYQWLLNDTYLDQRPLWRIKQRFALATLYFATDGKNWLQNQGWLDYALDECDWAFQSGSLNPKNFSQKLGIGREASCNEHKEYIWIALAENNLVGSLPEELFLLTKLHGLEFTANKLTGTISSQIAALKNLTMINLSTNDLSGTIPPDIGLLSDSLQLFGTLNNEQIKGSIPSEIVRT